MTRQAWLPGEALSRWRALEGPEGGTRAVDQVLRWHARLAARACSSGGRLGHLLVENGICDLRDLEACTWAQLDAGPVGDGQLRYDLEADLDLVAELAPLDRVVALSASLASSTWPVAASESVHETLATRLIDAGRERDAEEVLSRLSWHGPLLDWLERHGSSTSAATRQRLVARAGERVAATHLAPVHRVGLFVRFAELCGDRAWVDRARDELATVSREDAENSGEPEPLETVVALGLAHFGAFDEAMTMLAHLDPVDRWNALVQLVPLAPSASVRAPLVDELIAGAEPLGRQWWRLLDAAPEALDAVVSSMLTIPDEGPRLEALGGVLDRLDPERALPICARMVERARATDPSAPDWTDAWELALEAVAETGCRSLIDVDLARQLTDELLAHPDVDLWREVAPFVPDDRVEAVLELSRSRLEMANHYVVRDRWLAVGFPLLARVPRDQADRWREIGAVQLARTTIDSERLRPWSPAHRRRIILARLSDHQRELLPRWLVTPWLTALGALERPLMAAEDPNERAEARRALDELTATSGWPTVETVVAVYAALGRCSGDDAVAEAMGELSKAGE
jgi:hypothetical protein